MDGEVDQIGLVASENRSATREVEIRVVLLPEPVHTEKHLKAPRSAALLEVIDKGAQAFGKQLLPSAEAPLDQLRGLYKDEEIGQPLDLTMTLAQLLESELATDRFGMDLVRAIRVNTRWLVAPAEWMTPKEISALAGLAWQEYSLYTPPESTQPLPPDTKVKVERGQSFEAQRDGKYGMGRRANSKS